MARTPRHPHARRPLWAALLALVALLAPAGATTPAQAQRPAVTSWKVTWQISAQGNHSESNDGFTSFTRRTTQISGEAVVTNMDDGTNLVSPFRLGVTDTLYAVFRHFDERNSFAINQFNIVDPGRYNGADTAWRSGHLFVPQQDEQGFYMSADAFGSDFLGVGGQRLFTYLIQLTTHEGEKPAIRSEQNYYSQILLNQVTASEEFDRIPGDPSGRFYELDEHFTVSPESGGMGGDMVDMPVHIRVTVRPNNECASLGSPIEASNPALALMRDSVRVRLEPDEAYIPFDGETYVKAYLTCDGVPIKGAELQFGADVVARSGYHYHHDPLRPRGWIDSLKVTPQNYLNVAQHTTDDKGMAEFLYLPGADTRTEQSDISGTYRLRGYAPAFGAETWVNIDAKVPDLVELPFEGPGYEMDGQTIHHFDNNFGTPATVEAVAIMGEKFTQFQADMNAARARRGAAQLPVLPLLVGDLSLPWGGHFDVSGPKGRNRFWEPPYSHHDMGEEVSFVPGAYYPYLVKGGMAPAEAESAAALFDLMVRANATTFGAWVADSPPSMRIPQGQGLQASGLAATGAQPALVATLAGGGGLNPVAAPGQPVRVALAYHNLAGDAPAPGAALTATLPEGLRYVGASRTPQSVSGRTVTWALGEIPAGALPEEIVLDLAVEPGAAVGATLPVTLQLTAGADAGPGDNQASVAVAVLPLGPDLHVASTLDEAALVVGTPTRFDLTLSNFGTAAAASSELSIVLPVGATVAANQPAPIAGDDGRTLRWPMAALAPNEARTVALTLTLDPALAAAADPAPLRFELRATAAGQTDLAPLDNEQIVERPLDPSTDVAVSLARRGAGVADGQADYILGYTNMGGQAAGATSVTLTLDQGISVVSAAPAATSVATIGGQTVLTWAVGELGRGQGDHIVVRLAGGPETEGRALQAEAHGAEADGRGENNIAALGATWSVPAGRPAELPFRVALPLVRR